MVPPCFAAPLRAQPFAGPKSTAQRGNGRTRRRLNFHPVSYTHLLLSGGQRQALTLLMATLVTPKLLLLDEHTAALDLSLIHI